MNGRVLVLVNAKAGTVLQRGADATAAEIREAFDGNAGEVEVRCLDPSAMEPAISAAAERSDLAALVAGGGDGTLSLAASKLAGKDIALGCLPLGTMNLYCRSLGMPLEVAAAAKALGHGRCERVDLGEVNGRVFLHHVSIGLQPEIVARRNRESFSGRLGKIAATVKSAIRTLRDPKALDVTLALSDERERHVVSALFVTSNPLVTGAPCLVQSRTARKLGVYICKSAEWSDLLQVGAEMLLTGRGSNGSLEIREAPDLTIERTRNPGKGFRTSVDGEIVRFRGPLSIACKQSALRLLVPA